MLPSLAIVVCGTAVAVVLSWWTTQQAEEATNREFLLQTNIYAAFLNSQWEGYIAAARSLALHMNQASSYASFVTATKSLLLT